MRRPQIPCDAAAVWDPSPPRGTPGRTRLCSPVPLLCRLSRALRLHPRIPPVVVGVLGPELHLAAPSRPRRPSNACRLPQAPQTQGVLATQSPLQPQLRTRRPPRASRLSPRHGSSNIPTALLPVFRAFSRGRPTRSHPVDPSNATDQRHPEPETRAINSTRPILDRTSALSAIHSSPRYLSSRSPTKRVFPGHRPHCREAPFCSHPSQAFGPVSSCVCAANYWPVFISLSPTITISDTSFRPPSRSPLFETSPQLLTDGKHTNLKPRHA